jgi:hypothetical protein
VVEEGQVLERIRLVADDEVIRKLKDPRLPSQEEIDTHYLCGHIPYRNWCQVCVDSMGRDLDHQRDGGELRDVPEYSFDYCFPGDECGFKWTVIAGREKMAGGYMASAVPTKGLSTGVFTTDKVLEFIDENGDRESKIIVKTDQENSIEYVMKDLVQNRPEGRTIVEESPKKSSGSNGVCERAVQEIEGRIRSILLSLQERLGVKVDCRERIIAFIPFVQAI